MSIVVSRNAWNKMANILTKTPNKDGFLFSAIGGGCNGFNFNLDLLKDKSILDEKPLMLTSNDVKLYVDPISEMFLLGVQLIMFMRIIRKVFMRANLYLTLIKNWPRVVVVEFHFHQRIYKL